MPSPLRNGNGTRNRHLDLFVSTVSERKIRRLNYLLLLFRLASFSFSLASAVFTLSNSSPSRSQLDFLSFRLLFAANAIVAVYSLFQMGAASWEIIKGPTLLPESAQLWFDFSHDQVFAYLVLGAGVAGAAETGRQRLTQGPICQGDGESYCIQADISVALGFAGFLFLALATLASGFRLVCFLATGSRFPM
ncbi:CASP-like protein 4C1 [Carex littledalei]|uniref:CASP-like protein n=1 Tax=Carex littledalei TaxID=544730 RepID=A0A833QUE0_9POAL|nr:CASP-like protein 4C1 [Carex littledalei]